MMDTPNDYIKHAIVKCRARATLYHISANKWKRAHWLSGIFISTIAAGISIASFIAQHQDWSNTEVGMIGGLVLAVSNSVITSLKTGQNQTENEKAGDTYRNLEEKILAEYSSDDIDHEELKNRCQEKLQKLTNQFQEPDPQLCIPLEEKYFKQLIQDEKERISVRTE